MAMTNDELVEKLTITLSTPGWIDVIVPSLMGNVKACVKALTLSPAERKDHGGEFKNASDEELRIEIKVTEKMLATWPAHIETHRYNRMRDELATRQNGGMSPPFSPTVSP